MVDDLSDMAGDRPPPVKKSGRPRAAGTVPPRAALILLAIPYCVLMAGWLWSPAAMAPITGYVVLNIAYSHRLEEQPVVDLFSVAPGFVPRVYTGAEAIAAPLSIAMAIPTLC